MQSPWFSNGTILGGSQVLQGNIQEQRTAILWPAILFSFLFESFKNLNTFQ